MVNESLPKSLYKHALGSKSINKKLHEFFLNVTTEENKIDLLQINQLREKISSIFNFTLNESWKNCDEVIFPKWRSFFN